MQAHNAYSSHLVGDSHSVLYGNTSNQLVGGDLRLLGVSSVGGGGRDGSHYMVAGSSDVVHSWALPVCGMKSDCVPGRCVA